MTQQDGQQHGLLSSSLALTAGCQLTLGPPRLPLCRRYYLKVMSKLSADGGFLAKETTRLQRMMDDSAVKPAKKEQFGRRLNVLTSFV